MRRLSRLLPLLPLVLIGLAVMAALATLVVIISREGPDQTVTGTVTQQESHGICVARPAGPDICLRANSPRTIGEISTGDCVRVRYSAEDVLISVDRVNPGCEDVKPNG